MALPMALHSVEAAAAALPPGPSPGPQAEEPRMHGKAGLPARAGSDKVEIE